MFDRDGDVLEMEIAERGTMAREVAVEAVGDGAGDDGEGGERGKVVKEMWGIGGGEIMECEVSEGGRESGGGGKR